MDGQTYGHSIYHASTVLCGKNLHILAHFFYTAYRLVKQLGMTSVTYSAKHIQTVF